MAKAKKLPKLSAESKADIEAFEDKLTAAAAEQQEEAEEGAANGEQQEEAEENAANGEQQEATDEDAVSELQHEKAERDAEDGEHCCTADTAASVAHHSQHTLQCAHQYQQRFRYLFVMLVRSL